VRIETNGGSAEAGAGGCDGIRCTEGDLEASGGPACACIH